MASNSFMSRFVDRLGGAEAASGPLTPLIDEHLAQVSGGGCGCGHSSNTNHASSGDGPNHSSTEGPKTSKRAL
ncbi:MAG TPA: hypothetical protein VFN28_01345 [Amaricoccus sp.]|jgi:hypothetical protein|nr:hypothetical protein [Amaricoccus sp.]